MKHDDLMAAVRQEFAEVLELSAGEVALDAHFYDDLGGDSLQKLELITRVEHRCGLKLTDEEAVRISSVRDAVDLIAPRLGAGSQ